MSSPDRRVSHPSPGPGARKQLQPGLYFKHTIGVSLGHGGFPPPNPPHNTPGPGDMTSFAVAPQVMARSPPGSRGQPRCCGLELPLGKRSTDHGPPELGNKSCDGFS